LTKYGGLDSKVVQQIKHTFPLRLKNFLASFTLVTLVCAFYSVAPYFQDDLSSSYRFSSIEIGASRAFLWVYIAYSLRLLIFYFTERAPGISKSIYCWRALRRLFTAPGRTLHDGLDPKERLGLLACLVKGFFAPLMVLWFMGYTVHMLENGAYFIEGLWNDTSDFLSLFNSHGYWFLFQVILFFDVLFFTIGYLIELPRLKNQIRSVDPTLLGWIAALICYPPLNLLTNSVLGWQSSDFPQFENTTIHVAMNLSFLLLMAIYASASVALNFKASNLTHRGIISAGPYRFVRHPAYMCKNLAWWIGTIPALLVAFDASLWAGLLVVFSMAGWTSIYLLRALTEEDHLRKVDDEYSCYCEKVRYRFIPGIY